MKIFILLAIFILNANANANYIKKESVGKCFGEPFYPRLEKCGENCIKIDQDYNCNYSKLTKKKIKDLSSPIWGTRSMVSSCDGEQDCVDKALNLECIDDRHSLYNEEYSEIWCNKVIDYAMIETDEDIIVVDETKKALYEQRLANEETERQILVQGKIVRAKCEKALDYIAGLNTMASAEQVNSMQSQFTVIFEALKNNRLQKAIDLISVVDVPEYASLKLKLLSILEE